MQKRDARQPVSKHTDHVQRPKLSARNASRQFCVNTGMTGCNKRQTQFK